MNVSALSYQFRLPPEIFQERDALAAIRGVQRLPDLARTLCLRIGMLLAAAVATSDKKMQGHAMSGFEETVKGMIRFRDFLEDPCEEGVVHPVAVSLFDDLRDLPPNGNKPLTDLANGAIDVVARYLDNAGPTEADLSLLMAIAHGDFPAWVEAFSTRVQDSSGAVQGDLEARAREARERAIVSQKRIADVARTIRLISLNARVEASRAGDMGLAFGVIADEIKALSERTAQASEEVGRDIECMSQILVV